ncbi:MAG: hypothetical protein AB7S38_23580 [Vulcanimicrobiota bacterium]
MVFEVSRIRHESDLPIFAGRVTEGRLVVGFLLEARRQGEAVCRSRVTGVCVGGRWLDQASPGDEVEILLRGEPARQVKVGDVLHHLPEN